MLRFLVVDDSRTLRTIATRMLVARGFATIEAADGQAALELCTREMPDAILLDWNMPVMDGPTFLRALRNMPNGHKPKVIFCTTESDISRITHAISEGADEYIMKPFDDDIIESKLALMGLVHLEGEAA